MPDWSQSPPNSMSDNRYRLIRTPAARILHCVILAPQPIGCATHFSHGRTGPCEREHCEPCDQGIPSRWHAYIPVITAPGSEHCILELTAQAADQLNPALAEYKTLRGIEILCERPSKRPNGRIRISIIPGLKPESSLPPCPKVIACMLHIWGGDDIPAKHPEDLQKKNRVFTPETGNHDQAAVPLMPPTQRPR